MFKDYGLSEELQLVSIFEKLTNFLLLSQGVYEMGYEQPSPIQEESIPAALAGKNIVARAKNGTGKTAAYAIPLIQMINPDLKKIQALVLVPTRELAMQTSLVIKNLSKHLKIECMVSTGGTLVREDFYRLSQTVHVIVATPGRILDLASKKVANLEDCNLLVLDEVDKLLSMDFKVNIENILNIMNEKRQIMMFSATYPV